MFIPNFYLRTLKPQFQNPNFFSAICHLHNHISKRGHISNPAIEFVLNETRECQISKARSNSPAKNEAFSPPIRDRDSFKVQISHPWPEWADLIEKLSKNGYVDEIGNPFASNGNLGKKEVNLIRTACLNFSRDQYQLIRYLSRKDIVVIAETGCPSLDRKVVNSGKRLRAHVGINEGNVCSSCILRGDCDRAYVKAREDEGGRTVDVMRVLLPYCLDPTFGYVENKPCLNKKVKESVRALVKEMVSTVVEEHDHGIPKATNSECYSSAQANDIDQERRLINVPMKQGDWICSKCNFLNFARNVKCLRCDNFCEEKLKLLAEEQDGLPLKKGDWKCHKCHFLNFARNTRCLQCKENPPKRQLGPGEWECDSCNYINFRRNMVCLKCDHKRPIASNTAQIESQPASNNENHHEKRPWMTDRKLSKVEADDSLKFIDFPIFGGKSDLSRDVQKQESWKNEMANRCGIVGHTKENTWKHKSSVFHGRTQFLPSHDGDDEMAEWFRSGKHS